MNPKRRFFGAAALAAAAAAAVVVLYRQTAVSGPEAVPGMVRQTDIRIAPETTGRLASLAVRPGQHVRRGDVIAVLDNPELAASVAEARAAAASARAERDRVYSGVRAEEVAIAAQAVETAQANLVLARAQATRTIALASRGHASRQQLDDSTASLAKAEADLALKQAQHAAASAGPIAQERALADARVALAHATLAALEAELGKTRLTAPADGVVGTQVAEPGEIVVPGKPVMIIEAAGERWFGFTLREDRLHGLRLGSELLLSTADGRRVRARVTELRPLGEFATWRAARAVGDHDLNSFRLRADPVDRIDGLEPGMTVWLAAKG